MVNICIVGNPAVSKTTITQILEKKYSSYNFNKPDDVSYFQILADTYEEFLPEKLNSSTVYIILDAYKCCNRILQSNELVGLCRMGSSKEQLLRNKNRYIRLAIRYQLYYIDNTEQIIDETVEDMSCIIDSIKNGGIPVPMNLRSLEAEPSLRDTGMQKYLLPNPDFVDVKSLPIIVEGCSKIVRSYDDRYNIIEYKPTVYSHKSHREGVIEGTQLERMRMTKDILYLLEKHWIQHAYVYVGNEYVLCKKLNPELDIPNVEVIVKKCHLGTDPHRYYKMNTLKTRHGLPLVWERNMYPEPVVRFDYRNPNRHPEEGTRMGDEAMCDDLADQLIDVSCAKLLAKQTFQVLDKYFKEMGVFFEDVCFMITTDGMMHWSEISQDCGRYKLVDDSGMTPLDKDIWRAGGSSELVLQKWHQMTNIVHEYVKKNY